MAKSERISMLVTEDLKNAVISAIGVLATKYGKGMSAGGAASILVEEALAARGLWTPLTAPPAPKSPPKVDTGRLSPSIVAANTRGAGAAKGPKKAKVRK